MVAASQRPPVRHCVMLLCLFQVTREKKRTKTKVKGDRSSPDAVCGQAGVSGLTTAEGAVPVTEESAGPVEEAGTEDGEIAAAAGDSQADRDTGRSVPAVQGPKEEEGSCSFARHWCGAGGRDRQEAADRGQRASSAGAADRRCTHSAEQ